MGEPVIRVEGLGKRYYLSHEKRQDTLRDSLTQKFRRFLRQDGPADGGEEFWALRDISFDVQQGEIVGIIGRNGAGKSTLLKILSQITEPTTGSVRLRGRIASLLEVGTGFHPELSGRENIFLNGAILGMSRAEITRKFDEIVAFAEVERFLDTPVKHYSSGMYVRLAFAVAAHLEPDILIVDEVLAVGDAAFQQKCLGKVRASSQTEGRTVLLVSHDMGVINGLCQRAFFLKQGWLATAGPAAATVARYLQESTAMPLSYQRQDIRGLLKLISVEARDTAGTLRTQFGTSESIVVRINFEITQPPGFVLNPVIEVRDAFGTRVFSTTNFAEDWWYRAPTPVGRYVSECRIPGNLFNDASYFVDVVFCERIKDVVLNAERCLQLDIVDSGTFRDIYLGRWQGMLRPACDWKTSATDGTTPAP